MKNSKPTTNTDDLTFVTLGTSEDTLSRVLADCGILYAEPLEYPLTDGVWIYIVDRNGKPRVLEISVTDDLIFDPESFNGVPLVIRLSDPITPAQS